MVLASSKGPVGAATRPAAAAALVVLVIGLTGAAPPRIPPNDASDPGRVGVASAMRAPPPAPDPPPSVSLVLEAPTTRGRWTMHVKNDGPGPVRIVADVHLLTLEVRPRSARASVLCELPADMRPEGDVQRSLVLPPGRFYSETFEPRFYCFGGKLDVLAPGATVIAHLGWTTGPKTAAPFEVSPIDGIEPAVAPVKSIESPPVVLPDEPSAAVVPVAVERDASIDAPRLSLQGALAVEAEMSNDIAIPVTLKNEGSRPVTVRFRPEELTFDLIGPAGVEHCKWPVMPADPQREMFTTLAPGESTTQDVLLESYCIEHGLDEPGLLVVRPRLDTREARGAKVGLQAFEGEIMALTPTVVRLHRGANPAPWRAPHLDD